MPAALKALFSTSIYSNYVWSTLNLTLSRGLRFLGVLLCIRQVGMHAWGQVAASVVTITLLGFLVDQGLGNTPQIFRVGERGLDKPLLAKISFYRLAMALVAIAVLRAGSAYGVVTSLVAAYSLIFIPRALNIDWLFHRREQYQLTMVIASVRTFIFLGLVLLVLNPASTAMTVIAMEIASEAGGLLFSYALLWTVGKGPGKGDGAFSMRTLLIFTAPVLLTAVLETIPGTADVYFLRHFLGYESVGQFDIGGKIGLFYFFFGAALIQIIIPKLARLHAQGDAARMGEILKSASKVLLVLASALAILSFYYSEAIVQAVFKNPYPLTVFAFRWFPVWVYASCFTMINTIVLLSANRRREYLYGVAFACALNVLGNWALIGRFGGNGVVFARIFSETVLMAYAYLKLPDAIRSALRTDMGTQAVNLAVLIALYFGTLPLHRPWLGCAVSLAWCACVIAWQRTFTRRNILVLVRN
jgi:O-antigen/teichoic acid export membrane protein